MIEINFYILMEKQYLYNAFDFIFYFKYLQIIQGLKVPTQVDLWLKEYFFH